MPLYYAEPSGSGSSASWSTGTPGPDSGGSPRPRACSSGGTWCATPGTSCPSAESGIPRKTCGRKVRSGASGNIGSKYGTVEWNCNPICPPPRHFPRGRNLPCHSSRGLETGPSGSCGFCVYKLSHRSIRLLLLQTLINCVVGGIDCLISASWEITSYVESIFIAGSAQLPYIVHLESMSGLQRIQHYLLHFAH